MRITYELARRMADDIVQKYYTAEMLRTEVDYMGFSEILDDRELMEERVADALAHNLLKLNLVADAQQSASE